MRVSIDQGSINTAFFSFTDKAYIAGSETIFVFFKDRFSPAHFATFVAAFATPVAVPSVPMVQEMGGDVTLAGQLVVWSTLASAITVFLVTLLLRMGGAF